MQATLAWPVQPFDLLRARTIAVHRYCTLTAAGRKQLAAERAGFDRMIGAIQRVLRAT